MAAFLYKVFQRRSIFYYLLFLGYQIFIHPWLLNRLPDGNRGQTNLFLGCFFLALFFLELWGYWLKHPIMVYYARRYPLYEPIPEKPLGWAEQPPGCPFLVAVVVLVLVLRLGLAYIVYLVAAHIGGLDGDSVPVWLQLLYVVGFFVVLVKETGVIGLLLAPYGIRGHSDDTYPILGRRGVVDRPYPAEIRLEHLLRDALGDLVLLAFSMVAYTILWEGLVLVSPVRSSDYLGLGFYFLIAIFPLYSASVFQAVTTRQTRFQRIWMAVSLLLIVIVAMASYPRI